MHITLSFGLELSKEDKQKVLSLIRIQPKYIASAIIKAGQYPKDETVVFGGKTLFEKLCKNHSQGRAREKLKKEWKEKRQGTSISYGSKSDKGNRLLKFVDINKELYLRITVENRELIYAQVKRKPSNERDSCGKNHARRTKVS